jgi:hypothetical protein
MESGGIDRPPLPYRKTMRESRTLEAAADRHPEPVPISKRALANDGVEVRLVPTAGSVDNLAKLRDPTSSTTSSDRLDSPPARALLDAPSRQRPNRPTPTK